MDLPSCLPSFPFFEFFNFIWEVSCFPPREECDGLRKKEKTSVGVCVYAGVILDSRILKATAVYLVIVWS